MKENIQSEKGHIMFKMFLHRAKDHKNKLSVTFFLFSEIFDVTIGVTELKSYFV